MTIVKCQKMASLPIAPGSNPGKFPFDTLPLVTILSNLTQHLILISLARGNANADMTRQVDDVVLRMKNLEMPAG